MDNPYRFFSNYYLHKPPFRYVVPVGNMRGKEILCEHANKALHCTKASLFGDKENFEAILAESDPGECQALGRKCKGFDNAVWDEHVDEIAVQVLIQKFNSDESLKALLLSTGDALIANANKNPVWGIGFSKGDPEVHSPQEWTMRNVQGRALMRVREHLRALEGTIELSTSDEVYRCQVRLLQCSMSLCA